MNWPTNYIIILILTTALLVRLPGLGSWLSVDEENWIIRSSQYWDKLFIEHDLGGTFITTHPGTTLMALAGAAVSLQENRLDIGVDTSTIQHFKLVARLSITLSIVVLLGWVAWLVTKIFTPSQAFLMGLLLALEPYAVGMSQIVHLDMLLALFMLSAVLCTLLLRRSSLPWPWLVASGLSTGLAMSTKLLPSLSLIPLLFLIVFIESGLIKTITWRLWARAIRQLLVIFTLALIVFVTLWPAVLVARDGQFGYISRDARTIITDEHVALSATEDEPITPQTFYIRAILGRVTPLTAILVGSLLFGLILTMRLGKTGKLLMSRRRPIIWLIFYALAYLIFISFAAKKADRYALPGLIILPLLAGYSLDWLRLELTQKINRIKISWLSALIVGMLIYAIIQPLAWAPYAIAYSNPLWPNIRPLSQQGWGEGLEAAAAWLNQNPLGKELTVATWYPSVLRPFFQGKTMSLSSINDYRVGYVVTYRNMGGRAQDSQASDVLDEVKKLPLMHVVKIKGVPYVWIYETKNVGNYTKTVGEIVGGIEVGQTIMPTTNELSSLEIGFATFSNRLNTRDVILSIYDSLESTEPLRIVTVNASKIVNNEWHRFEFAPIEDAAGHEYYFSITSPDSVPGNAVTVRYTDADVAPGNMVLMRRPLNEGTRAKFIKTGDTAYRLN